MPTFVAPVVIGTTAAASGSLRLPNNTSVNWRNGAGSGDFGFTSNSQDGVVLSGGNYFTVAGNETFGGCLYATVTAAAGVPVGFRSNNNSAAAGAANQGTKMAFSAGASSLIQSYLVAAWEAIGETDSFFALHLRSANAVTERFRVSSTGVTSTTALSLAGLTGATAASRLVGATTSGKPASGTFSKGDVVVDQTGNMWVNTVAGSPGTWADVGSSNSFMSIAKWGVD